MHKCSLRTDGRQLLPIYTLQKNKKIWKYYQTILKKLTGQHYTPQKYLFTLNVPNTNKYTTKLTITIIQIILFEIQQSRNNNKYDKKSLPQQTIINKINAQLKTIILAHYKKHKLHETH